MKSTPSLTTSKPPRLRVGLKDVSREEFSTALNTQLGKQRVSIMLDGSIIAFFKAKAGERDRLEPTGERLGGLAQQLRRGAAQEKEPGRGRSAIGEHT